jgi:hypothetical protein
MSDWLLDPTNIHIHNIKETHKYGMLFILGILFPLSILTVANGTCFTRMFRKIWHATLQTAGVFCMYFFSIPMMRLPDDGTLIRETHKVLGYFILFGGLPLMILSRYGVLKAWHKVLGKTMMLVFAVEALLGALKNNEVVWIVVTLLILAVYGVYILRGKQHPDILEFVTRTADGQYVILESFDAHSDAILPVGSGWSSYLNKQIWTRKQYSLTSLKGRYSKGIWGAGTTVAELQSTLKKEGKSVSSHPSVLGATIGSWIFTNSHGNGGELWTSTFGEVTVLDVRARAIRTIKDKKVLFQDQKTIDDQRLYIILDAKVYTVDNALCLQEAFVLRDVGDAARFFDSNTLLRAAFVDAHEALCITWTTTNEMVASNTCSMLFPIGIFGTKILPHCVAQFIPKFVWRRTMTLYDANRFVGSDPPYFTGFFAYFYTNVEIFVKTRVDAAIFFDLCGAMKRFFRSQFAGRCEVRYENGKLCLDFVLMTTNYRPVFDMIYAFFGRKVRLSIHKGKYQVPISGT